MVGRCFLALVDLRLHQTFPEYSNIPFGGRSIIIVGDFGRLPPVCDLPMYSQDSRSLDHLSEAQFQEAYKDEQRRFRDLLFRLSDGEPTQSDWELLMT